MKIISVGGYPGAGKSTIVRRVIEILKQDNVNLVDKKDGLVNYLEYNQGSRFPRLIILGSYPDGEKFPGTDRLSMGVQPDAIRFLADLYKHGNGLTILYEGDRIFNQSIFTSFEASGYTLAVYIVAMSKDLRDQRRGQRSDQNQTWVKGRESKVDRLSMLYPFKLLVNNQPEDIDNCAQILIDEIEGKPTVKEVNKIKNMWG